MTRCTGLRVDAGARFPLLLHHLAKAGEHEFAVLLDLLVFSSTLASAVHHWRGPVCVISTLAHFGPLLDSHMVASRRDSLEFFEVRPGINPRLLSREIEKSMGGLLLGSRSILVARLLWVIRIQK